VGAATGDILIGNLPFLSAQSTGATADGFCAASLGNVANWLTDYPIGAMIDDDNSTIALYKRSASNNNTVPMPVATASPGANGNIVFFSAVYAIQ
jgi:hypothetical protein